jgi:ribonuclease-3
MNVEDWAAEALGHRFGDPALLKRALTHASASSVNYERLEFLGDRVLGVVIASWLYTAFAAEEEGKLARRFADIVSRETCADAARRIGVQAHIVLGRQARGDGAHGSDNVLGDVCEALIGALYVDGGMAAADAFVRRTWAPYMGRDDRAPKHPKSRLQEWANGKGLPTPAYEIVARTGPQHAPCFRVRVSVRGHDPIEAEGSNKQEAETAAAEAMLEILCR